MTNDIQVPAAPETAAASDKDQPLRSGSEAAVLGLSADVMRDVAPDFAELKALSERLLQLANDEGTAQIHDAAMDLARLVPFYQRAFSPKNVDVFPTDRETVQTLLDLLNPLHGELDRQTYDEKYQEDFDVPPDREYTVDITARMERDLTQAVVILENRKKTVSSSIHEAWSIVKAWLNSYAEEESLFSRYKDEVILDGIMNAGQRRALSAFLDGQSPAGTRDETTVLSAETVAYWFIDNHGVDPLLHADITDLVRRARIDGKKQAAHQVAQQPGWQPIETAPKDGTVVFIAGQSSNGTWFAADAKWDGAYWYLFNPDRDTYDEPSFGPLSCWMPIPAFPSSQITSTEGQ